MIQQTLFGETDTGRPLASRMRPRTLEEFAGQRHLLGEGKVLRQLIDGDRVPSMVFWGPPGVGKTTLARIIANRTKANFIDFSAVTSGIKEIKEVMQTAEANRRFGEQTILFVDEIHRFNKAQQDAFLPFVEKGSIILIGATTENPSFEINSALLSRCKVFVLHGLSAGELTELLRRALTDPRGFGGRRVELAEGMLEMIANFANGDARTALNTLEMVVLNGDILPDGSTVVPMETLEQCISKNLFCMISTARSTTILSQRCTNPCATATRTLRYTGWPGCWRRGRTRCMWRAAWCALPAKMWAWPTAVRWRSAWRHIRRATFWVCRSVRYI